MTRSDNELVEDILRSSLRLGEIADCGRLAFSNDWTFQDAAIRQLGVVGEALNGLSDEFKDRVPGLPVEDAKRLGDRAAHRYWTLDLGIIWETISSDIPALITLISSEYAPPPTGSVYGDGFTFPRSGHLDRATSAPLSDICGAPTLEGGECKHPLPRGQQVCCRPQA